MTRRAVPPRPLIAANTVSVDIAHYHSHINCLLGPNDYLLDERVVNGLRRADNRHRCVGKYCIPLKSEEKLGISADLRKTICPTRYLSGRGIDRKFKRV